MAKSTINRTWIAGLVILAAGLVLAIAGGLLIFGYGGTFNQVSGTSQYDFTPRFDGFFWTMISLVIAGGLVAAVGGLTQLAAWIGALVNSYQLPEKTWFVVLLLGGIFGLAMGLIGFAAMLAYVVAGPDGLPHGRVAARSTPQGTLAPTG